MQDPVLWIAQQTDMFGQYVSALVFSCSFDKVYFQVKKGKKESNVNSLKVKKSYASCLVYRYPCFTSSCCLIDQAAA